MIEGSANTGYEAQCDMCPACEPIVADTWDEMLKVLRGLGWTNKRLEKDLWMNLCPDCTQSSKI